MKLKRKKASILNILPFIYLASALWGNTAHAAITTRMCSGGTLNVPPVISISDATLESVNATDCFYASGLPNSNPTSETSAVNLTTWAVNPEYWDYTPFFAGDADFSFAAKPADGSDPAVSNTVLGVTWSLTFNSDGGKPEMGTWELSWVDPSPTDLPDYFDIVLLLKGASAGINGYLFDDVNIPITPTSKSGTYTLNLYGTNGKLIGLSHPSVLIRAGFDDGGSPPQGVPVPGTLFLLGLGLLGLRFRDRV